MPNPETNALKVIPTVTSNIPQSPEEVFQRAAKITSTPGYTSENTLKSWLADNFGLVIYARNTNTEVPKPKEATNLPSSLHLKFTSQKEQDLAEKAFKNGVTLINRFLNACSIKDPFGAQESSRIRWMQMMARLFPEQFVQIYHPNQFLPENLGRVIAACGQFEMAIQHGSGQGTVKLDQRKYHHVEAEIRALRCELYNDFNGRTGLLEKPYIQTPEWTERQRLVEKFIKYGAKILTVAKDSTNSSMSQETTKTTTFD
jgi:hypothetical protein